MDTRDFQYAVSQIKLLRKYHKEGWHHILSEEKEKLETFLRKRNFILQEDENYLYTIKGIAD